MDAFRVWLIGLMAVAVILTVLSTLLPEGSVKKIAGITGGLVLLLTLLRGLRSLDVANLRLSYDDCAAQISRQTEAYREQSLRNMESLIAERCGAYISEQAQTFGISCSPQVEVAQTGEGIAIPSAVTMDVSYHAGLAQIIAENLGIDEQNQKWLTSEG